MKDQVAAAVEILALLLWAALSSNASAQCDQAMYPTCTSFMAHNCTNLNAQDSIISQVFAEHQDFIKDAFFSDHAFTAEVSVCHQLILLWQYGHVKPEQQLNQLYRP